MTHQTPAIEPDRLPELLDRAIAYLENRLAWRDMILAELRPAVLPALELLAEDQRRRERLAPGDAV